MKKWQKWLQSIAACTMAVVAFAGCGSNGGGVESSSSSEVVDDGIYTVSFDLCTDLKTNKVLDQEVEKGGTVTKPKVAVIGDNPNNSEISAWYTDPEYTEQWNFLTDTVESDMTLYAEWIDKFTITYYLGDELETPMFSELIKAGQTIPEDRKSLSDGYRSEGFFLDPDHTVKYDFEKPVTGNTDIYIDRSDEFYFTGKMIAERFTPVAANSGKDGATAGNLEYVEDGDDSYAKVNFGYSPTVTDAHINLSGVKVDITSSQKVKIRMKNMGGADTIKLYYVIRHEDDSPIVAQFYNETCAYTYKFKDDEKHMTEEDEWLELVFDLSAGTALNSGIVNGVSLWANADYLNQLRLQSQYQSTSPEDLSNEFWIQSIEGVKDDTYVNTADTPEVDNMLEDDDAAAVQQAADAQEEVVGWVFPKNNADVSGTVDLYDKTNGLLMYAPYRGAGSKMILMPQDGEAISMDDFTTLTIRLQNYGYATSFKLKYYNTKGRSAEQVVNISSRDSAMQEYKLNMFGATNWNGTLKSIEITYDSVGVDNAILFECVEFSEYVPIQVPGFNFDDKDLFGATSNEAMEVSYDKANGGTLFNVIDAANAVVERAYTGNYTNMGYKYMTLNYAAVEGITAVNVALTVDGEVTKYEFPVSAAEDNEAISVELTKNGNVENVKVTFTGTGSITIQNIMFEVDEYSLDFSMSGMASFLVSRGDWGATAAYDANTNSTLYSQQGGTPAWMKYYFGVVYGGENKVGLGNIPLEGKSKIIVVYQNTSSVQAAMNMAIGITDITDDDAWKTDLKQMNTPGGGTLQHQMLQANMGETEWAYLEFDLFSGNLNSDNVLNSETAVNKALAVLMMQFSDTSVSASIKVRAIAVV